MWQNIYLYFLTKIYINCYNRDIHCQNFNMVCNNKYYICNNCHALVCLYCNFYISLKNQNKIIVACKKCVNNNFI